MLPKEELPATREEAKALGLKTYQGTACHAGHTSGRITSTGGCIQCNRDRVSKSWHAKRQALLDSIPPYVPEQYVPPDDPFHLIGRTLPKPKRVRRRPGETYAEFRTRQLADPA
jgi:hypothetical protein